MRISPSHLIEIIKEIASETSEESDLVTITTTDGESIDLPIGVSGLDTGWAVIANPYYHFPPGHENHDPNWKWKDGDTVIGVEEGEPGALPVADAYQELHQRWDEERSEWDRDIVRAGDEEMVGLSPERIASAQASLDAERAAAEEEEVMLTPEEGEDLPSFQGMGRRHDSGFKHGRHPPGRGSWMRDKLSENNAIIGNKMKVSKNLLQNIINEELHLFLEGCAEAERHQQLDPRNSISSAETCPACAMGAECPSHYDEEEEDGISFSKGEALDLVAMIANRVDCPITRDALMDVVEDLGDGEEGDSHAWASGSRAMVPDIGQLEPSAAFGLGRGVGSGMISDYDISG